MSTTARSPHASRALRVALVLLSLAWLNACDRVGETLGPSDDSATLRRRNGPTAPAPPSDANEPLLSGSGSTLLWSDDFESHASDAELLSRYITMGGESGVHVDASAGLGGSRAIRVDWRAKAGCTDDGHLIEASLPARPREVVVQYSVRYTARFVFDWIGRGAECTGNAKKLFFLWPSSGSRFDFISENHVLGMGSDQDHPLFAPTLGGGFTPEQLGDGSWHRITLRVRQSSTPSTPDGAITAWVDGVQRWSVSAWASHSDGGWALFKLPTTFNQGSPVDQAEWLDDLRIWTPGG